MYKFYAIKDTVSVLYCAFHPGRHRYGVADRFVLVVSLKLSSSPTTLFSMSEVHSTQVDTVTGSLTGRRAAAHLGGDPPKEPPFSSTTTTNNNNNTPNTTPNNTTTTTRKFCSICQQSNPNHRHEACPKAKCGICHAMGHTTNRCKNTLQLKQVVPEDMAACFDKFTDKIQSVSAEITKLYARIDALKMERTEVKQSLISAIKKELTNWVRCDVCAVLVTRKSLETHKKQAHHRHEEDENGEEYLLKFLRSFRRTKNYQSPQRNEEKSPTTKSRKSKTYAQALTEDSPRHAGRRDRNQEEEEDDDDVELNDVRPTPPNIQPTNPSNPTPAIHQATASQPEDRSFTELEEAPTHAADNTTTGASETEDMRINESDNSDLTFNSDSDDGTESTASAASGTSIQSKIARTQAFLKTKSTTNITNTNPKQAKEAAKATAAARKNTAMDTALGGLVKKEKETRKSASEARASTTAAAAAAALSIAQQHPLHLSAACITPGSLSMGPSTVVMAAAHITMLYKAPRPTTHETAEGNGDPPPEVQAATGVQEGH